MAWTQALRADLREGRSPPAPALCPTLWQQAFPASPLCLPGAPAVAWPGLTATGRPPALGPQGLRTHGLDWVLAPG